MIGVIVKVYVIVSPAFSPDFGEAAKEIATNISSKVSARETLDAPKVVSVATDTATAAPSATIRTGLCALRA